MPKAASAAKLYGSGFGHANASVADFRVLQYRSYQRDVHIYHLHLRRLSLPMIRKALQSQKAYRDKLTSFDPIQNCSVVEGDEMPPGCIEAAYMPSILHGHGSALALRSDENTGRVEWYIFSEAIHDSLLSQIVCKEDHWMLQSGVNADDHRKVFDLVGYAEKGLKTRTVRNANREHKGWYDSLCNAKEGKKKLKLTWKGYGGDLRAHQEQKLHSRTIGSNIT